MAKVKTDPNALLIPMHLEGEWRMDEEQPQFGGTVKTASGDILMESDFPPLLGGKGRKPSPLQLCFWGGMSCFASIFAVTAALEGIELKKLTMRLRGTIDFRQPLGLGDEPPISGLSFEVAVQSDATDAQIERVHRLAEERCPASWMMKNVVPFETSVVRG